MTPDDSSTRISAVQQSIAKSARLAGREPDEVTLIAVSKTQPAKAIQPLIAAGQRIFGENRVQEAEAKWPALRDATSGIELHLIGQLQSNKADDAVALFDAIHSLDRLRSEGNNAPWAVVATAHPAKFESVVEPLIGHPLAVPASLAAMLARPAASEPLAPTDDALCDWLLAHG